MNTSSIAYHQGELQVALDRTNAQRLLPDPGEAARMLDIGCGAGQTIVGLRAGSRAVGVDIDLDALRVAARGPVGEPLRVAAARGERLPFAGGSFDYVYSRVALPYMDIPCAIAEMHRVLRPGGRLWLALHPVDIPAEQFRRGNLKGKVYALYTMLNGAWFHLTGRTMTLPGGICESIQTRRGMTLALTRAGFHGIAFHRTRVHFTVTAER
ncbi:MAG TPA: class I SAM-dependent methyltransferase [Vicinamibacterales bacterium]|nr:class I SAM-dependent methyltransferase [Vicinamibacterales bacterium]